MNFSFYLGGLGDSFPLDELCSATERRGHALLLAVPSLASADPETPIQALADDFASQEETLRQGHAEAVAVAATGGEWALVGAITALKLGIPVLRVLPAGGGPGPGAGGGIDGALACVAPDAVTVGDPEQAASEIAAWAEALPTLPAR